MGISYDPLWKLLIDQKRNKTYLRNNGIHPASIAKMGRNERVSLEVLEHICRLLECDISDIVEYKRELKPLFTEDAQENNKNNNMD